jgi:tetratricopeptide (TPR) repeat protein
MFVAILSVNQFAFATSKAEAVLSRDMRECATPETVTGINDYRERASTPRLAWDYEDNMKNHTRPAMEDLRNGVHWQNVIGNLNFTLNHWPNHLPALKTLIEFDLLSNGKRYGYKPTKCYFFRARQIFPDDVNVVMAQAYWVWKKGDRTYAKSLYEEALGLNPESAEANYNLGLLLYEMADYSGAREHARAAYAHGYPLPGLRNLLEKKGFW